MFFKCKHPADSLDVKKEQTTKTLDPFHLEVTYHFVCSRCNKDVNVKFARYLG